MSKYYTRDTVQPVTIPEEWHKLKNFQSVPPLTVQQQIDRFLAAGRQLQELQGLGVYDFNENQPLDDDAEDVTRDPDFDIIDAAVAHRNLVLKLQSAQADGTEAESMGNVVSVDRKDVESVESNAAPREERAAQESVTDQLAKSGS